MNADAPGRAVRLVYDMGENAFVWIIDARDRDSIEYAVVHFDSRQEAESAESRIATHISSDCSIDELIEVADIDVGACDREAFGGPEQIVDYLGGKADQALQWNARKMLADMAIARD
jgi:hypothetical protein